MPGLRLEIGSTQDGVPIFVMRTLKRNETHNNNNNNNNNNQKNDRTDNAIGGQASDGLFSAGAFYLSYRIIKIKQVPSKIYLPPLYWLVPAIL